MTTLASVHEERIVHRCLSLENIVYHKFHWKLAGFYLAVKTGEECLLPPLSVLTPPEIFKAFYQGKQTVRVTGTADVWAIGLIAHRMYCKKGTELSFPNNKMVLDAQFYGTFRSLEEIGELLVSERDLPNLEETINDRPTRSILRKMLTKDPGERQTARFLAAHRFFQPPESSSELREKTQRVNFRTFDKFLFSVRKRNWICYKARRRNS